MVAVTNGRLDFGTWERIFAANSTGGGGSGCWSRSSGNSGNQGYHERNRLQRTRPQVDRRPAIVGRPQAEWH
jgi:hypothetical protein